MSKTFLFILNSLLALAICNAQSVEEADSLYLTGNYSKAIEIYKSQNDLNSVYDKLAKSYVAIGNYDEALLNYQKSISVDSSDALINYEYAKLLSKTKKFKEAKNQFNNLLLKDITNPNYHYELGLVLEQLNDSTDLESFKAAYKLDDTHQKAIFKIAKYYLVKRMHETSHQYIDNGLASYPNNVELISLKAQNYYWNQQYHQAIEQFEKLIELGETSDFIFEKLSLSYANTYQYKNAIEYREKILKQNPTDGISMYVIGTYYADLQEYPKAEKYLIEALTILDRPMNKEYMKLGFIYNSQQKYKEAIETFDKAMKEDPSDNSIAFFIARSQEEYFADVDAKIQVYENYRKKYPESPYSVYAEQRIKSLKEKQFLEGNKTIDTITKD